MDKRSGRNEHPVLSGEESGKGEKTINGMVGRNPTWTTAATVTRLNATFQLELQVETPPRG